MKNVHLTSFNSHFGSTAEMKSLIIHTVRHTVTNTASTFILSCLCMNLYFKLVYCHISRCVDMLHVSVCIKQTLKSRMKEICHHVLQCETIKKCSSYRFQQSLWFHCRNKVWFLPDYSHCNTHCDKYCCTDEDMFISAVTNIFILVLS